MARLSLATSTSLLITCIFLGSRAKSEDTHLFHPPVNVTNTSWKVDALLVPISAQPKGPNFSPSSPVNILPVWESYDQVDSKEQPQLIESTSPQTSPLRPHINLQSLNRSVAFSDGASGPDISWKIPQGFRWSNKWFLDASILGANINSNSNFFAWNNGDAVGELHLRIFQQQNWTLGVNASIRSIYQGSAYSGGSTPIGDGFAMGFRIDHQLSPTSGIAIGGEQIAQFDSNNDTGRNFYIVASNGWWLGGRIGSFPLLIGTMGLGTGRLADNDSMQFGCTDLINSSIDARKTFPLCWSPIASSALLFSKNWSLFAEYNSQDILSGLSANINDGFPVRLSWGVLLANKGTNYNYVGNQQLRWFFRASISL
jgi:hypothetical protein